MKRADSIKHPFRYIAVAVIVIGVIGLIVWDHVDPPLWYHFEAQKNKRVIMEYAEEHFPEAKIVEEHYNSAIPFQTSNKERQNRRTNKGKYAARTTEEQA